MSEINTNTCETIGERAMSSSVYFCACVCVREKRACFCLLWEARTQGKGGGRKSRIVGWCHFST